MTKEESVRQDNGNGKSYLSVEDGDHAVLAYNGSAVYIQHHEKEDSVKVAVPTDKGLEVKFTLPYDHTKDLDRNFQEAFAQYKSQTEPSETKEKVYYASVAYLQSTDDTSELDKLKERGDTTKAADAVDCDGFVHMSESRLCPSVGNVNTDSFDDIWNNMRAFKPCGKCHQYRTFINSDTQKAMLAKQIIGL